MMGAATLLVLACAEDHGRADRPGPGDPLDTAPPRDSASAVASAFDVLVTLDGVPTAGVRVLQPGSTREWVTEADGRATVDLDLAVVGELFVVASHPDARILGAEPPEPGGAVAIELVRFDRADNPSYVFQDPGTPDRRDTTGQCAHCHGSIDDDWWASPHRTSASSAVVQDLYAGTVAALAAEADCADAGGRWLAGLAPGTGVAASRCYLGDGALPALNPDCATTGCDTVATAFGGCADCHAPGIDGDLGGRHLLDAVGFAYEGGVHCDVCHKVEAVDDAAPAGVAGFLAITRPSEPPPSLGVGDWHPLTFGPYADVPHVRMGSVHREHFHEAVFCAGCHQLDQEVLVPGAAADPTRWPDGRLPIHSTYAEWLAGPMNPAAPCRSCHMPPDPTVGNSADLGADGAGATAGVAAGWYRPPGAVRHHAWYGPRQRESGMLELAATVDVETAWEGADLVATVTVTNVGPGHAIPTGEPLRTIVLLVEATCGGAPAPAVGGDAVPDFGGTLERKESGEDWTRWSDAAPGDVVRVVRRTGAWRDYVGHGPFGDGTFDAADKGMPVEEVAGEAVVTGVAGGVASFDRALPAGDTAYLGRGGSLPADGEPALPRAGAPGFAFARVLVGPDGRRMVPHFLAVDVASDNRLLPQQSATTVHRFAPGCADPVVSAVLVHRAYPPALAAERRWTLEESVMARVDL